MPEPSVTKNKACQGLCKKYVIDQTCSQPFYIISDRDLHHKCLHRETNPGIMRESSLIFKAVSIVTCLASLASVAIIVVLFLKSNETNAPISIPAESCNTSSTIVTNQNSTSNFIFSCWRGIEWSPEFSLKNKDANEFQSGPSVLELSPWKSGDPTNQNEYRRFILKNSLGIEVELLSLGATITAIRIPDKNGKVDDVTLGFDSVDQYLVDSNPYFGATVGRVANRIAFSTFEIDGVVYNLTKNRGEHHLHGGIKGFHSANWHATINENYPSVTFSYLSKDGEEGYPGNLNSFARYSLSPISGEIKVEYWGMSDKKTPINLSNHIYINLAGHNKGRDEMYKHKVQINAAKYTPMNDQLIVTGEMRHVTKTPFDFRVPKYLGAAIFQLPKNPEDENGNSFPPHGFDHNFIISDVNNGSNQFEVNHFVARFEHDESGRFLEVHSNQPGVQFYTGNFLPTWPNNMFVGKDNSFYEKHGAFTMETQIFPNAVNEPKFRLKSVWNPGELYYHHVTYNFGLIAE